MQTVYILKHEYRHLRLHETASIQPRMSIPMFLKIRGSYMGTEEDNCARSCSIRRIAQTPLQEQRIAARRREERHPSTRQQVPNLEVLVVSQNYLKTLDQLSALDMCAPIGNFLKQNERCRICILAFFAEAFAC